MGTPAERIRSCARRPGRTRDRRWYQPRAPDSELATISKRVRSSTAPSRRTASGSIRITRSSAHLAGPAPRVPLAGAQVEPVLAGRSGARVVVPGGQHEAQQPWPVAPDQQHRDGPCRGSGPPRTGPRSTRSPRGPARRRGAARSARPPRRGGRRGSRCPARVDGGGGARVARTAWARRHALARPSRASSAHRCVPRAPPRPRRAASRRGTRRLISPRGQGSDLVPDVPERSPGPKRARDTGWPTVLG